MQHLIYPVMFNLLCIWIITYQIIVFIIPRQSPRTDVIPYPIMAKFHFLLHIPLIILEFNLLIFRNCFMNRIHSVIDALIHCFNSSRNKHLPLQFLCIIFTDQCFQLFNQCIWFFLCNKFWRLNRIHQKLQLRQFKIPGTNIITRALAFLLLYIQSEFIKNIKYQAHCHSNNQKF